MDLRNIFSAIEKFDPEVYEKMDTRRDAMKSFAGIGRVLALTAVPFALGGMFKKAYGGTRAASTPLDVLNYALTLEYLEAAFYANALSANATSTFIAAGDLPGFQTISAHETAHVKFLQTAITGAGGTPVTSHTFDFTAGGAFANVFSNYDTFLAVSQTFEDTGVRAYKGRAGELLGTGGILTAALNIHSVEARHASFVRQVRATKGAGIAGLKPWITGKNSYGPAAVQASYNGEDLAAQAGVTITGISTEVDVNAATEAFDEPLTAEAVLSIVSGFIVS